MKFRVLWLLVIVLLSQCSKKSEMEIPATEDPSDSHKRAGLFDHRRLSQVDLHGTWITGGNTSITVRQSGLELTFIVNNGDAAGVYSGRVINATTLQAFGQYGTLNASRDTIQWSAGTVYTFQSRQQPVTAQDIAGKWITGGNTYITVDQWGMDVLFTVENGAAMGTYPATFVTSSTISGFNQIGYLSPDNRVINWQFGTVYSRL